MRRTTNTQNADMTGRKCASSLKNAILPARKRRLAAACKEHQQQGGMAADWLRSSASISNLASLRWILALLHTNRISLKAHSWKGGVPSFPSLVADKLPQIDKTYIHPHKTAAVC